MSEQTTDHSDLPEVDLGASGASSVAVADVEEAMKDVVDPELGINVVDLGLVYGIHLDEGSNAVIDMTLTSARTTMALWAAAAIAAGGWRLVRTDASR